MVVYRIGITKFSADITGEGARLHGGRWNHKLTPCIYTSESRSLALLEYTVNVSIDEIPRALSFTIFDIPDEEIYELKEVRLPGNWKAIPAPSSTKDFGTTLLQEAKTPVLKIPSIVVVEESNYLLNPLHKDSKKIKILDIQYFVFDVRLKK